jgi:NADH:ubiquinone oxidoreductase subunit F (NADH-binding)/ferredoxin
MVRRPLGNEESIRFRIDATRCDGQGVCAIIAPELFELDRYGLAFLTADGDALAAKDPDVRARGLEASAMCPRNAIREELAIARAPIRDHPEPPATSRTPFTPRLKFRGDDFETLADWRASGGWQDPDPRAIRELVRASGLRGQGGAGYPVADKWRRMAGADGPVVVMNGSEREPGTAKDRYLLTRRPFLVLDGLRIAMRAVGAQAAFICIDEGADDAFSAVSEAVGQLRQDGSLDALELEIRRVPERYVAGEETALLSVVEGGKALPRLRPPYPSDSGLFGRATLVHNVETLATVAVAATIGAAAYRSIGTVTEPGSGLFTVGPLGGPYSVVEAEYGRRLRDLLDQTSLLGSAQAVLVGGYAGGLLPREKFDVPLDAVSLRGLGASLGTKSLQVLDDRVCPVGAAEQIVRYFGDESAGQCPPCSRGLPDMAAILGALEAGTATTETLADLQRFMSTLGGRGVCRLPDGAARVVLSLLTNFAETVTEHLSGGCQR